MGLAQTPAKATVMALTRELAPLSLDGWAEACAASLEGGARLLALFGRVEGEEIVVTAVLQTPGAGLELLRSRAPRGASYPSLTARFASAQMPERELWEQTGLVPDGHPWLKPVRFEGNRQQRMDEYPFFTVRGSDVHEVGVGPIHASVIEPGHFRFMCHGERVAHLEIQLGYQHRGVEALLLKRPPLALTTTIESIAGDSSIAYAWGYCAAVEALAGLQLQPEVELVRAVALELERIAMHLVALTGLATDIAFLQGGATYGRLRTAIINATQRVCGNRFGRGWLRPGGVRHALDETLRRDLLQTLEAFGRDFREVNELMLAARSVQSRFQGTGTVSTQAAIDIGLVGLAARASGVPVDARRDLPGRLYTDHRIDMLTESGGDCWARMRLRMREIEESLRWLNRVMAAPELDLGPRAPERFGRLYPDTVCMAVREGFRGPVVQVLETDAGGRLLHYKVQDPSMLNWFGLAQAVRENEISDFPICNKSFDLSYCGNDL
jgi:Ni,Fe-hydrogenase III large subunit